MKLRRLMVISCLFLSTGVWAESSGEPVSLKSAYAGKFVIGAAVGARQILGEEPGAQALMAREFDGLTPENVMKWALIHPEEEQYDFVAADALVDFAQEHGQHLTGHTLLWHQQTPAWVFQDGAGNDASAETLGQRLDNHIDTVVNRYKGRIQAWDVVNEVLNEDGSLRETSWLKILGPGYIAHAFKRAEAADPNLQLLINDYNLYLPAKRDGMVRLVKALREQGARVDGVGMQGHYGLHNPDLKDFEDSIKAFIDIGLTVSITELDVAVLPFPDSQFWGADISVNLELNEKFNPYPGGLPVEVAQEQAERYADLFRILLKYSDHIDRVTFWGLHDGHSWKNGWPMAGRTEYPLLFDRQLQPKPAYHAVLDLVSGSE